MRRLTIAAISCVMLLVALWGGYYLLLRGNTTDIRALAASTR
jgi:hypothetical protein